MQSFDSLGRIAGPIIGGLVYELHMDYTFVLGAVFLFATMIMVRPLLRRYAPAEPSLTCNDFKFELITVETRI
jgi:predicted MFS family arabinose efflux permease